MAVEVNAATSRGNWTDRFAAWFRLLLGQNGPFSVIERIYRLVAPYGRAEIWKTLASSVCQSIVQVIGVASIGPFIAVISAPDSLRDVLSKLGPLDRLATLGEQPLLIGFGIALISINALSCVVNIAAIRRRAIYAQQIGLYLRENILNALLGTTYDQFSRRNSSTVLNNINTNTEQFSSLVLLPLLELLSKVLLIVFLVILMLVVSPLLTLLAATTVMLGYAAIFRLLARRRASLSDSLFVTGRETTKAAQALTHGFKVVCTSNAEPHFVGHYRESAVRRAASLSQVPVLTMAPKFLMETVALATIVLLALVAIGSGQKVDHFMSAIGILAFAAYRILPTLQQIYHHATSISSFWYTVEEMESELLHQRNPKDSCQEWGRKNLVEVAECLKFQDQIKFDRVCYRYPDTHNDALHNICLTIPKNCCLGLSGPSGAGKSTFVDVLLGLLPPTSGMIQVDGVALGKHNLRSWRQIVAYVPQDIFLIDESLEKNIAFGISGGEIDRDRVEQVCITAQLDSWVSSLPGGLQTRVGDNGVRLSGGQRQRVALARALYRQPDVLILDEATSALDQRTESAFVRCLNQLQGQLTMIMIAHRLSTLKICDRIVYVSKGRVEERQLDSVPLEM